MLRKLAIMLITGSPLLLSGQPIPPGVPEMDSVVSDLPDDPGSKIKMIEIYYPEGKPKSIGLYDTGKKTQEGAWKLYFPSGVLNILENYRGGMLHGPRLMLDGTGRITGEESFYLGKKHGLFRSYSDGKLRSEEIYKEGILNGRAARYYANGSMQEEGEWRNGERNGETKWYYDNGQLLLKSIYASGSLEGYQKAWFNNGAVQSEGSYVKNMKEGAWKEYHDNGKVRFEGNYLNDKKEGLWKEYDKDGKLISSVKYKAGIKLN